MEVVVSATGNTLDSEVDPRFGRCSYFILVELNEKKVKLIKAEPNKGNAQWHGAGIAAGQQVAELKAKRVITGALGPNSFQVLQQMGIEAFHGSGSVKDVLEQLQNGKLTKIESSVGGHFGQHGRGWRR